MKIQKCTCGTKPVKMAIDRTSGYIMCPICHRETDTYHNDLSVLGKNWKEKAIEAWNKGNFICK